MVLTIMYGRQPNAEKESIRMDNVSNDPQIMEVPGWYSKSTDNFLWRFIIVEVKAHPERYG